MSKLLRFLITKKNFLLFILLESISMIFIVKTHQYAQVKTHDWQTAISGSINKKLNIINRHFYLQQDNKRLQQQNAYLLKELSDKHSQTNTPTLSGQFDFIPAYVLSNQYHLDHNSIIINKGRQDSVQPETGVITTNGIVGVVQKTSKHYARVISILNKSTKINVALAHTNYTGFMQWPHQGPNTFEIIDMPVNARIKKGDTIVTSGLSSIFPKGIPVGTITDYKTVPGRKSYVIKIKTFADMTNIGPVYVVKNRFKTEVDSLKLAP